MKTSCAKPHPNGHCECTAELGHRGDHVHAGSNATWPREAERLELANEDAELGAMRACVRNLDGLEQEAIERIVGYLQSRFIGART